MNAKIEELNKKYQMAQDEHARKYHSNITDEESYRDSCKRIRAIYADIEREYEKAGGFIERQL